MNGWRGLTAGTAGFPLFHRPFCNTLRSGTRQAYEDFILLDVAQADWRRDRGKLHELCGHGGRRPLRVGKAAAATSATPRKACSRNHETCCRGRTPTALRVATSKVRSIDATAQPSRSWSRNAAVSSPPSAGCAFCGSSDRAIILQQAMVAEECNEVFDREVERFACRRRPDHSPHRREMR
jgi:hypothetical protein